ncbi:hypothetical protein J7J49_07215 [Halomonas sp. ISL-56]|uniref:hypothetical protein n=1 Tax=Halomonas sp. ISL-56 TaxID=2819149 RepID=UPI001BECEB37|nr:hypothetical protein [Halomonas sp. ISL-56]MBT2801109.1 hypothetical protein [Halomonas sp. ISL-56]
MKVFYSMKEALEYSSEHSFLLVYRHVFFPVYINYKGKENWLVFTPGACSRNKPMPIFQRSSYSEHVDANVISLFDPGLLLNKNLTNTWFSGTPARYFGDYISDLLKSFFKSVDIEGENVFLFGTSAGGLPAFKIAQKLKGATVWCGNIQTKAYKHSAFKKMLPVLYPNKIESEVVKEFSNRFDISKMDGDFKVYYFQNRSDEFHYKNHYKPFMDWYFSSNAKMKVVFSEYYDVESGHGSIGRLKEYEIIDKMLRKDFLYFNWIDCTHE